MDLTHSIRSDHLKRDCIYGTSLLFTSIGSVTTGRLASNGLIATTGQEDVALEHARRPRLMREC